MTAELTTGQGPVPVRKDALAQDLSNLAGDAGELLKEKLEAAGSRLGEVRTVLAERARQAAGSGNEYVKAHPWRVLGLAAAVGVIVGILAYRR